MKTALSLLRCRCNYSQAAAARAVGVSRQVLSAWESGTKSIPPSRLNQLANLFGVEPILLTEQNLAQVEQLCDRPIFSRIFEGRQVFSFSPSPKRSVDLEAPSKTRPEERGTALVNRKHKLLAEADMHLSFTPGH